MKDIIKIKQKALEVRIVTDSFQELVSEFLNDRTTNIMDKVHLTEWLEQEGLGEYV